VIEQCMLALTTDRLGLCAQQQAQQVKRLPAVRAWIMLLHRARADDVADATVCALMTRTHEPTACVAVLLYLITCPSPHSQGLARALHLVDADLETFPQHSGYPGLGQANTMLI